MRYYKIVITDPNGNLVTTPSSIQGSGATYTSFVNNQTIPGALQIELDIPLAAYATPVKGALLRIWGVSLAEIGAATQLNPKQNGTSKQFFNIAVYGGMQKGLPLANPQQAGLIAEGSIFQAFGNWVGNEQSLDLILQPFIGNNGNPKNLVINWKAGQPLSTALATSLSTAFPKLKQNITISDKLVLNNDEMGYYATLEQFASYLKSISASIVGGNYGGADVFISNGTIFVDDMTTAKTPRLIAFQDLIGQPTWIEGLTIQFKCVMRGDISVLDYVKLPPAIITTTSAASSSLVNLKSTFEGSFMVNQIRHVGNFRQPDAASWVTTFNAAPQPNTLQAPNNTASTPAVNTAHSR